MVVSFLLTASSTKRIWNYILLGLSSTPRKLNQSLMVTRVYYNAYFVEVMWNWILLFGIDFIGGRGLLPLPFERFVIRFVLLICEGMFLCSRFKRLTFFLLQFILWSAHTWTKTFWKGAVVEGSTKWSLLPKIL